jgi:gluconolactonase
MRVLASDLWFPEGPVWLPDGSLLVVEIRRGTLTRIAPDGSRHIVATLGGGPNGAALASDGAVYVCNNGGFDWFERDGVLVPTGSAKDYSGGRIERVDLATGRVERLYDRCGELALRGPNDLVFDAHGGFWFTDFGKRRRYDTDLGCVYYARADGSQIREVLRNLIHPNGIGLSPDGRTLYVAETDTARLLAWDVTAPGEVRHAGIARHGGRLVHALATLSWFDSLAVHADGSICVATISPGGITVCDPAGGSRFVALPDYFVTNICFGGARGDKAYITQSTLGELIEIDWPARG